MADRRRGRRLSDRDPGIRVSDHRQRHRRSRLFDRHLRDDGFHDPIARRRPSLPALPRNREINSPRRSRLSDEPRPASRLRRPSG